MKCLVCGTEFESERATAKYCTGACRAKADRISARDRVLSARKNDIQGEVSARKSLAHGSEEVSARVDLVDPNDPEVIERGLDIADEKKREMSVSNLPSISLDEPCKNSFGDAPGVVRLDLEKDLGLDLRKDLGCFAVTKDGWFIRPDITIQQVRNIRRLVEAKHGWPHRAYDDENPLPYSTSKSSSVRA